MVKYQEITLDRLLHAVADPTRRGMIDALVRGERSVSELAEPFQVSLPAVMKHLGILSGAGLISQRKVGRRVMCNLEPRNLIRVATWLAKYQKLWEGELRDLKQSIGH